MIQIATPIQIPSSISFACYFSAQSKTMKIENESVTVKDVFSQLLQKTVSQFSTLLRFVCPIYKKPLIQMLIPLGNNTSGRFHSVNDIIYKQRLSFHKVFVTIRFKCAHKLLNVISSCLVLGGVLYFMLS